MEPEIRQVSLLGRSHNGAFDWGIVGVDLDDVEIPLNNPNDTPARFEPDTQALATPSGSDFAITYRPIDSSNESTSIFDRFPDAFVYEKPEKPEPHLAHKASDRASVFCQVPESLLVDQNRLPYSWMVQNPGQLPKALCSESPRPGNIKPKPDNRSLSSVEGETRMEEELKRGTQNPFDYFLRATAFTSIMELNSIGLIHPTLLAVLIGRLFNGEPRFLEVFNRFFMPSGLRIEPTTQRGVVQGCLLQLRNHLDKNPTHARHQGFIILNKVMHHFASRRVVNKICLNEIVGKLVDSSNGREYRPNYPGCNAILWRPRTSRLFLGRRGEWWPFKNFTWQKADQLGLLNTPEANGVKSTGNEGKSTDDEEKSTGNEEESIGTGTVDPRLLVLGANPEPRRER